MIYAVLAKPSFEPISTNHLGSNKLHAEADNEGGSSSKKRGNIGKQSHRRQKQHKKLEEISTRD
jgi:hypothetical protein